MTSFLSLSLFLPIVMQEFTYNSEQKAAFICSSNYEFLMSRCKKHFKNLIDNIKSSGIKHKQLIKLGKGISAPFIENQDFNLSRDKKIDRT
jgi:hypothetical protein